jgi:hypothetical protein
MRVLWQTDINFYRIIRMDGFCKELLDVELKDYSEEAKDYLGNTKSLEDLMNSIDSCQDYIRHFGKLLKDGGHIGDEERQYKTAIIGYKGKVLMLYKAIQLFLSRNNAPADSNDPANVGPPAGGKKGGKRKNKTSRRHRK